MNDLLDLLTPGNERVGFILKTGEIVEVDNVCDEPEDGFDVRGEDLLRYLPIATASWHTHPGTSSNLSVNDYETFLNHPNLDHFIIGDDGITKYVVRDGVVIIDA